MCVLQIWRGSSHLNTELHNRKNKTVLIHLNLLLCTSQCQLPTSLSWATPGILHSIAAPRAERCTSRILFRRRCARKCLYFLYIKGYISKFAISLPYPTRAKTKLNIKEALYIWIVVFLSSSICEQKILSKYSFGSWSKTIHLLYDACMTTYAT